MVAAAPAFTSVGCRHSLPVADVPLLVCCVHTVQPGVEGCILTTPNAIHAEQAELCLSMGKHVLIEIPMGMSLAESERLAALEAEAGGRLVCMVCHSQRYGRGNREIKRRVAAGELTLHHIVQQTYFLRRKNENRFGTPRSWTDDLLWHQVAHLPLPLPDQQARSAAAAYLKTTATFGCRPRSLGPG